MALTIFGLHNHPNDFPVTKIDVPVEECVFLLDFSRPLERCRQLLGRKSKFLGVTVGLLVPMIHIGEHPGTAGYVFGINRGEPYFLDIPKLWKKHAGTPRGLPVATVGALNIAADLGLHFPNDC